MADRSGPDVSTEMSTDQIDAYLDEPRHAIAGVIRSDGAPQLSPVWALYENGKFYISVLVNSAKFRHLERDPRMSLCIDAGHPDARFVVVQGVVNLVREKSPWSEDLTWRITRRYHESEEQARLYSEQLDLDGPSALVVLSPERIFGRDFN